MAYPHVTTLTLAGWLAAIQSGSDYIPLDTEAANLLAQIDVQTRRFIYDYLSTKFDATTEKLLVGGIADASLAGTVKGSTSNSGTQQAVVQGTVSTPDLRDLAVSTAKLDNGAVTTAKITDAQVTTAKILDSNITTAKLAANAVTTTNILDANVTTAKLADSAVTSVKITDSNVTTVKIADLAVTSGKFALATTAADILVANSGKVFTSTPVTGDITISNAGVVTLAALAFAVVREVAANTVAGGASLAGLNTRGTSTLWLEQYDPSGIVTISGTKLIISPGTYIINAFAPCYSGGLHAARLAQRLTSDDSNVQLEHGTAEVAQLGEQSRSHVTGRFTVTASHYFRLEHYIELVKATNGLGMPSSSGLNEVYAVVVIQKVSN